MASNLSMTAAAVVGAILLGAAVGAGWSLLDPVEEPVEEAISPPDGVVTRVFFETAQTRMVTAEYEFPLDGMVEVEPLDVDLVNVTEVAVTLHARLEGVALRDEFELRVHDPFGSVQSGSYMGPLVNLNGYEINPEMVQWRRALPPTDNTYETADIDEALQWSAENHTHRGALGPWRATLQVSTPSPPAIEGMSGRSGNFSLSFTFTHYEAVAALVDESRPFPECEEAAADEEDSMDRHEDPGCPVEEEAEAEGEPADARGVGEAPAGTQDEMASEERLLGVEPRSFITETLVGASVDRDPGPERPL
jgi:hypothetical protein